MPVVNVEGEEIFYHGNEGALPTSPPVLICIHGAGGTGSFWKPQVTHLKDIYPVIAVDLPGHGKSKGKGRAEISDYAAWLKKFIEALSLPAVCLMGHSMGGGISIEFTLACPELVSGLILVGTGARLRVAPVILEGIRADFNGAVEQGMSWVLGPEPDKNISDEIQEILLRGSAEVYYNDFAACDRFDRMQEIGRISCPTLILCGEEDKMTPPKYSHSMANSISQTTLHLFPGAGHMAMLESPGAVNQAIEEFLKT